MHQRGVTWAIHYVDDFLTMGRADSDECQVNMALMHQTCHEAGLPLEPSQTQGPCPIFNLFGNPANWTRSAWRCAFPRISLETHWTHSSNGGVERRAGNGIYYHSSEIWLMLAKSPVRHSRIFLRRLINLSTTARLPMHFIRLSVAAKSEYRVVVPVHKTVEWHAPPCFNPHQPFQTNLPLMHQVIRVAGLSMRRDGSNSNGPTHSRIHIFP